MRTQPCDSLTNSRDGVGDEVDSQGCDLTDFNRTRAVFFNHQADYYPLPIGKAECVEDSVGLYLRGELTPGLAIASDVLAAMKHGTIGGLSIGGLVKKGDYDPIPGGGKLIKRWHNLYEVSVVANPADKAAQIDLSTVKSIDFEALLPECKTERDIERLLRDAGLGKWEAMAIVSRAKAIFDGRDAPEDAEAKTNALILERLQKLSA